MNKNYMTDEMIKASPEKWPFTPHVMELETSIIREILKISSKPGVISLAGGYPSADAFPLDDLRRAACEIIDEFKSDAAQYSLSMGITPLRQTIAERETKLGASTKTENILITSGSQQGIELCARALIDPGDYIITEYPTYVGALQAFNFYQARYAPVEMDEYGMQVDKVEAVIKKYKPKMIYTISTFQNPTGITMTEERRRALIDVAIKYNIPIVEDNPYGDLRFSGEPVPSMKKLGGDAVISLGTFSKIVAPGLRIAWMNAPEKIIGVFEKIKQCADLHSNTFTQYMIYKYLISGKLETHIPKIVNAYSAKRNHMLKEMENYFPEGVTWTKPEGGLFLWCELPKGMSASEMLPKAIDEKVTYVYGRPFFPDGKGDNTMRLNFCSPSIESITLAIKRLGKVIRDNMS